MSVFRKINTSFWQDPFVLELTPEEKYFYLYIMTNTKTSQCGIYEIPKKIIEIETGYNRETIDKLINRFVEYGKVLYSESTNELMLINWIKYNGSSSPKVMSRVETELKEVKNKELVEKYIELSNGYNYTLDTVSILYPYSMDTQSQEEEEEEKEKEKEKEEEEKISPVPYEKIKDLFNDICKSYSPIRTLSNKRKEHLKARWKQYKFEISIFEELFNEAESSNFLKGMNKKNWKANFDWLINDNNMAKVLEGRYSNEGGGNSGTNNNSNRGNEEEGEIDWAAKAGIISL